MRLTLVNTLLTGIAAGFLLGSGGSFPPAARAQQSVSSPPATRLTADSLIVNTDLVNLTVTVTDTNGRYVDGLDKSEFAIYDDKVKQEISFFADTDEPLSVGIVFDMSGSMNGEKIERARDAVARFIEISHPEDEYFLIAFDSRAHLLLDRTHDSAQLLQKVSYLRPGGQTALFDAVYLAVEKLRRGMHERRAVIVISDGKDNDSRYSLKELVQQIRESGVLIYTVGIFDPPVVPNRGPAQEPFFHRPSAGFPLLETPSHQFDRMTLEEISNSSGGHHFLTHNADEMIDVLERIALELRHQYSIGYRPPNFDGDGRWHRIKVKVNRPDGFPRLTVRSRGGYYATANVSSTGGRR